MTENVVIFPAQEGDTGDENDEGPSQRIQVWLKPWHMETIAYCRKYHGSTITGAVRAALQLFQQKIDEQESKKE